MTALKDLQGNTVIKVRHHLASVEFLFITDTGLEEHY